MEVNGEFVTPSCRALAGMVYGGSECWDFCSYCRAEKQTRAPAVREAWRANVAQPPEWLPVQAAGLGVLLRGLQKAHFGSHGRAVLGGDDFLWAMELKLFHVLARVTNKFLYIASVPRGTPKPT